MSINDVKEYLLTFGQRVEPVPPIVVQIVVHNHNGVVVTISKPEDSAYNIAASHIEGLISLCDDKGIDVQIE